MGSVVTLGELLDSPPLLNYTNQDDWFDRRDEIKAILVEHIATRTTQHWLDRLEPADYWCAEVLDWERLSNHEAFSNSPSRKPHAERMGMNFTPLAVLST
ncbi:probable racemase [Vibrio variabilis]|uniref:Probable racemase n=1 Tax=Vibrio variabilis TaxID=990271 RepID=A0ABQ0JER8_9VIBR|nr:probable racemase [Vibrio variabilis]